MTLFYAGNSESVKLIKSAIQSSKQNLVKNVAELSQIIPVQIPPETRQFSLPRISQEPTASPLEGTQLPFPNSQKIVLQSSCLPLDPVNRAYVLFTTTNEFFKLKVFSF